MGSTLLTAMVLAIASFTQADSYHFKRALDESSKLEPRVLRPAVLHSELAGRGLENAFTNDLLLHYVESDGQESAPMAAHVSLEADRPTLILENIDHLLTDIRCLPDSLTIQVQSSAYPDIYNMLSGSNEFYVITTHDTCNKEDSRMPYAVSSCQFFNATNTIKLNTELISWRAAYRVRVDYGLDESQYMFINHLPFRRRDLQERKAAASTTTVSPSLSVPTTSTVTTDNPPSVVFPTPTGKAGDNQTTGTNGINKSYTNKPIIPLPGDAAFQGISINGFSLPDSFALTCVECSVSGQVSITSGSFSSNSSSNSSSIGGVIDFVEDGYVSIAANGLGATMNLNLAWPQGAAIASKEFPINLATIPLQPLSIPDLAVIGPILTPKIILAISVSDDVSISYGFTMRVPDKSTALASIGELNRSSVTGFDKTTFDALPFSANFSDPTVNLSLTFQAELLVGISFLDGAETAGAGVFLNLPAVALSIEPVSGTDENCNPTTNTTLSNLIESKFGRLMHIVPEVEVAAGFVAQAHVAVPELVTLADQRAFTPLAFTYTGPTTCLAFEKPTVTGGTTITGGFVTATAAVASATAKTNGAVSAKGLGLSNGVVGAALLGLGWVVF